MKQYIERNGKTFRVEVIYTKGGINYFTCKVNKRGYYLNIRPVTLEKRDNGIVIESFELFGGVSYMIAEVKRQSDKSKREADNYVSTVGKVKVDELINYLLTKKS